MELVASGRLSPQAFRRAIDLGCGSGANAIFLAEHGFDVSGVDFSPVALRKAQAKAVERGARLRLLKRGPGPAAPGMGRGALRPPRRLRDPRRPQGLGPPSHG
ncbi:MAG: class I SAM-dependent methyltransferase [Candidatus Rokuibacteriota bacterium]